MLNGSGDVGPGEFDIRDVAPPNSPGLDPRNLAFDDVLTLQPRHFEAYVAVLWSKEGFRHVTLTPSTGDGGVDVVALNGEGGELIQCKTSQTAGRELSWEAIKDVVTGEAAYKVKYPGVTFKKTCVATTLFNSGAKLHAQHNNVRLVDRPALEEMHNRKPITLEEVEVLVYSAWSNNGGQSR
jgi:HJR/Mrr/RecB family endonuclease